MLSDLVLAVIGVCIAITVACYRFDQRRLSKMTVDERCEHLTGQQT